MKEKTDKEKFDLYGCWYENRKCVACGGCLDIEEIKFLGSCPYCGETIE